jgi:lipoprotein NlpI
MPHCSAETKNDKRPKKHQTMWYRRIIPSPKNALSSRQVLQLTNMFLVNAYNTDDKDIGLTLCQHAEATLSEARVNPKKNSSSSCSSEEQEMQRLIATAYYQLGELLQKQGLQDVAQALFKRSEKWG